MTVLSVAARIARVPAVVLFVWALVSIAAPPAMARYLAFSLGRGAGLGCQFQQVAGSLNLRQLDCSRSLAEVYQEPLPQLIGDATLRSLSLLAGAAILGLVLGTLIGVCIGLLRRRAIAGGALVAGASLLAAIPSFFVAYFLQLFVILLASGSGRRFLPVFGFGYDEHIVLPVLAVAIPAITVTAQLVGVRVSEVLDADFIVTADAKGLLPSWIARVHVLPHAWPVVIEALGSGLRISVASLPIVEYLFLWNGLGFLALQAIASRDPVGLAASAIVFAALFSMLGMLSSLVKVRT
jgi:ABC-type dipeptide/oligopeptide/nickel transport system permease component